MKRLALALLLIARSLTEADPAADQSLTLSIAIPPTESGEYNLDPSKVPHFYVILSNRSNGPVKVWGPRSLASHRALSFEFTDENGRKSKAEWEEEKRVSYRLPDICSLSPGDGLVIEVPYTENSGWKGWPKIPGHLPTVKMQAVFESRRGAGTSGVWTGKVVSQPLTVRFYANQ
jgi:hypothetical protein